MSPPYKTEAVVTAIQDRSGCHRHIKQTYLSVSAVVTAYFESLASRLHSLFFSSARNLHQPHPPLPHGDDDAHSSQLLWHRHAALTVTRPRATRPVTILRTTKRARLYPRWSLSHARCRPLHGRWLRRQRPGGGLRVQRRLRQSGLASGSGHGSGGRGNAIGCKLTPAFQNRVSHEIALC